MTIHGSSHATRYLDVKGGHIAYDDVGEGPLSDDRMATEAALIATATTRGSVVAVAHITTGAPQVVRRLLPEFQRAGVVFVPVTEFLKEAGRP